MSDGRPFWKRGAHVKGHNRNTLGYVYVGGVDRKGRPKDTRTAAQKRTMIRLSQEAVREHGIKKISSHRDYARKACPSFNATKEYAWITKARTEKPLKKSRTVKGSAVAGAAGAGLTAEVAVEALHEVQNGLEHLSVGSAISVAIGLTVIAAAGFALYARWDDAGRPGLGSIWNE